jgi:hypothetical protein
MLFVVAEEVQLNWSKWFRQTHRWLSIVFTVAVIINGVTVVQGKYNNRLGLSAVAILEESLVRARGQLPVGASLLGKTRGSFFPVGGMLGLRIGVCRPF